jgi:3-oxoacyl-[acyl-carrier protein] reductase
MINENKKLFAEVNAVINNAGCISPNPQFLILTNMNQWWQIVHNNINCLVNVVRAIVPYMIKRKKGTIVNVASLSGISGDPGQSAYAASKAAIINLSMTLNKELSSFGITVNCVSPGLIDTKMADETSTAYREGIIKHSMAKRLGKATEVANILTYLAVEAPEYLVNQNITISGGL